MNLTHEITARAYALVKRSPRLRKLLLPLYRFVSGLATRLRSLRPTTVNETAVTLCPSVETWVLNSHDSGNWFKIIHPAVAVQRELPRTAGPVHWKFIARQTEVLPCTFVASLNHARVWEDSKVITTDNQLLREVSKEIVNGEYHDLQYDDIRFRRLLLPPEKLKGRTAVLSAPSGRGYYHWMFDVLPRLELIRQSGIEWSKVDCFLVNDYITRFHIETLHLLGLIKRKIRSSHWHPYLKAEQLIVPSLVGNTGHIPRWACDFLRNNFIRQGAKIEKRSLRLYLSRGQVAHRRVTNEPEVTAILQRFGFTSILLEALPFCEQVALLNHASVVVAAHGAGLTNIVFCNPGTKIIEILSPNAVNIMYWTLCNQIGLDYGYLLAEGARPPDLEDRYENSEDLKVDIHTLVNMLEASGVH